MKKTLVLSLITLAFLATLCACKDNKEDLAGVWQTDLYGSQQIIEFTKDGYFIDHTTGDVNRYRISGGKIVTYVEGEKSSEVAIPYSIEGDTLKYGVAEYTKVLKNADNTD